MAKEFKVKHGLIVSGSVGIGVNNPSNKLDVLGSVSASTYYGDGSNLTGITHYTDADTLDYINSIGVVSSSAQLSDTTIPGDLTIAGKLTAQEFHTEFVSASIIYESGSTQFGDTLDDLHSFTGSLNVSGSVAVDGKIALNDGDNNVVIGDGAGASLVSGQGIRNVLVGTQAGAAIDSGDHNVANGYQALFNNTIGSNNTANGAYALYSNTSGNDNVANGYQALFLNTTGNQNIANGYQALFSNTTGIRNIANGVSSLYFNTTGNYNTANGFEALLNNTTGNNNVANGYQALYLNTAGSNNIANGYEALFYNTTGYQNIALGYRALFSNTTGSNNIANGTLALYSLSTGSNNIAEGYQAGRYQVGTTNPLTETDNSVFIGTGTKGTLSATNENVFGYGAEGNGSNSVTLGNTSVTKTIINGNVGLGTTAPSNKLDVVGAVSASTYYGDGSNLTGITHYTDADTLNYINTLGVVSSSAQLSTEISGAFASTSSSLASRTTTLENAGYTTCIGDIIGVTAGTGLSGGGTSGTVTVSHADTSTLTGAQGSAGIASITVDALGHVTAVTTATYCTTDTNTTYTANDMLTCIKTVDGAGSGLDADLLDGQQGSYYLDYNNFSNKPTIPTNNNQLTNGAGYTTYSDSDTLSYINTIGVVSGSSQITLSSATGNLTAARISDFDTEVSNNTSVTANTAKVGYTDALVKSKLNTESVLSGSITSAKITDVDAFSQSGTYANLRAQGTTASDVGLGNVTNESKATMFTNAALTGNPTAPTQIGTDDSTKIATTAFVQDRIDAIIGTAGSALDTLGELSASLSNDQDALAALTTTVGTKLAKSSNLSDLTNVATARTNLGLGTAATTNSTAYATAAQGTNADTAYGWGDHALAGYTTCVGDITGVTAGTGLSGGGTSGAVTVSHADTSTLTGAQGSAGIASITVDDLGHVTAVTTATYCTTDTNTTYTANEMLTCIKTVDGAGSGLDADTLDGNQASAFYLATNPSGYTSCTGDITGVTAGTGLSGGGTSGAVTVSHADTSTLTGAQGSAGIASITVDALGHVTAVTTATYCTTDTNTTYTANDMLTCIKTVDGAGSGLDADTLDGQQGSYYLDYNNFSNKPTIPTNNNQLTNGAGYTTCTGTLTGTGTSGYISKWNGSTSQTNSIIYENGGKIGIGTSTLSSKLTVWGCDNFGTYNPQDSQQDYIYEIKGICSNSPVLQSFSHQQGSYWYLGSVGTGNLSNSFIIGNRTGQISYTERFRIDCAGNVGIGTTSPTSKLDVSGSVSIDGKIALNDGGNSVFIGDGAGLNDDGSNNMNTGVGYQALLSNTTGVGNVGTGIQSLYSITSGAYNVANGRQSLFYLTTGNFNIASGYRSLYNITTGSYNIAIGDNAGSNDVTIGSNQTSCNSIYIGSQTLSGAAGSTNEIVIGGFGYGHGSNSTTLGTTSTTKTIIYGNLGLGTTSPAEKLHVVGNIVATGNITGYYSSDERLKENKKVLKNSIDKINKISGYEFDWKETPSYGVPKHDVGVIAQEIEEVLPEIVARRDDGYLAVRYEKITPLIIEGIKELSKEVESLKDIIKNNGITE